MIPLSEWRFGKSSPNLAYHYEKSTTNLLSFCKSNAGQNVLFFIGPALQNKIPEKMKKKPQLISRKTKKP